MNILLQEIGRFIKDYLKLILVGSFILALLLAGVSFLNSLRNNESSSSPTIDEEVFEYEPYSENTKVYFSFLVEGEEGEIFNNNELFTQYFNVDNILSDLEANTTIDLEEQEQEIEESNLDDEFQFIYATRNENSGVITSHFNFRTIDQSMEAANYYYNLVIDNHIDFLDNKTVYTIAEPTINEVAEEDNDQSYNKSTSMINMIISVVKNGVVGFIVGFVAMLGLALTHVLFNKTLKYSFAYDTKDNKSFLISLSDGSNQDIVHTFITHPAEKITTIICENSTDDKLNNLITHLNETSIETFKMKNSIANVSNSKELEKTIIIVQPNETKRKWYNKQLYLSDIYETPVKILQLN